MMISFQIRNYLTPLSSYRYAVKTKRTKGEGDVTQILMLGTAIIPGAGVKRRINIRSQRHHYADLSEEQKGSAT